MKLSSDNSSSSQNSPRATERESRITLEELARATGFGVNELHETVTKIGSHYRRETRLIGSKRRALCIPSEHLKTVQRAILERWLSTIPPHPAAFCCSGRGVLDAARRHVGHRYLLHLDIRDFFPSTRPSRVSQAFARAGFNHEAAAVLTALTTIDGQLPQGAPTSVAVGNLVLERLDRSLWGVCRKFGLTYTRYVDDIAVSGGGQLCRAEAKIRRIVIDCGWALSEKGGLTGPHARHRLLGVLLGSTMNVDPTYLADLRRVLCGNDSVGQLSAAERRTIEGKIAWVRAVNMDDAKEFDDAVATLNTEDV